MASSRDAGLDGLLLADALSKSAKVWSSAITLRDIDGRLVLALPSKIGRRWA